MKLLPTQPLADQIKGLTQLTSGKLQKGDLLVFKGLIKNKPKDFLTVEGCDLWSGQDVQKWFDANVGLVSAWRDERVKPCTCYFFKYVKQTDTFGENWRCVCVHCNRTSNWFSDKQAAKKAFYPNLNLDTDVVKM